MIAEIHRLGMPGAALADYWGAFISFDPPLDPASLRRWVAATFAGRSAAQLWGNPIVLGAATIHVYGLDLATYELVSMEFTPCRFVFICRHDAERVLAGIVARITAQSLAIEAGR